MAQTREKKIMEYSDAPSGHVTLYNYKEPFMKFERGYGFQGVLLFDGVEDSIQCHFCGNWYGSLPNHLRAEHSMTASQYKDAVGLLQSTALISETMRAKLISSGLDKRLQNLRIQGKKSEAQKQKIRETLKRFPREAQNMRGTCPEQIIERLRAQYAKEGRTPHTKMVPFYESLIKTYGTYKNACEVAGIPYNDPLEQLRLGRNKQKGKRKIRLDAIKKDLKDFYDKNGFLATYKDFNKNGNIDYIRKHGGIERLNKEMLVDNKIYTEFLKGFEFSKEELLDFLRKFKEFNKRMPSYSDARRRMIPHLSRYSYHFGSWQDALKLAFPKK